jgi:peroxiredoxin Q/BCP
VVVYFYPKDDTPGCTVQGKSFTATKAEFDAAGIKIVGVSADEVASHKSFCDKFSFNFELLADPSGNLMRTLGLGQKEWNGMHFWERTTFVLDPKGMVWAVYAKVDPNGHERVLLHDIRLLQAEAAA